MSNMIKGRKRPAPSSLSIKSFFVSNAVETVSNCDNDQVTSSSEIVQRAKKQRLSGFDTKWKNEFPWVKDVEDGMMCTLCIRHQKRPKKAAFGNATWVDKPCTWLVKDALRRHERSDSHDEARAFEAGRLAPSNNVEAAVEEANSLHTKARVSAFRNLYWLMKREIPHTTNYLSLNELCKLQGANILNNLHQGENNKGESQRFIQEAVLTMGNLIRQSILDDAKVSPWYSIMIDETTDITVVSEMIVYIRYLKNGVSKTDFIGILPLSDGKADTITETLVTFLTEDLGLPLEKMCALGSDGAKVMVGRQNGVAAQLRRRVPHLVNNHCVAHRLALAVGQAAKGVPYLQKFKDIIGDLHRFYEKSAVRTSGLKAIQELLQDPKLKLVEAKDVRWLSHDKATTTLRKCLPSIYTSLEREAEERNDPRAAGLSVFTKDYRFVLAIHMMCDVLPHLTALSCAMQEYEENFTICQQFVISNLKYHRFLSVDSHKVTRQLQGVCDKLKIHSESKKALKLQALSEEFLETTGYEGKDFGKTDTHYSILLFLLLISNNPVHSEYVETENIKSKENKEEFDWGAYLLEGIEVFHPSDGELSDWTDEEDFEEEKEERVIAPNKDQAFDDRQAVTQYIVSDSSTVHEMESKETEDFDWLTRNLIAQYWKGEKLEIETGKYRSCQLNNNWEAYKERIDPLHGNGNKVVVSEKFLLREVTWMLMGVSNLYLLEFNGRFFVPKHEVCVPHLSEESLQNCLTQFTRYGAYIQILQNFVEDSSHGNQRDICQTYQSFASTVANFLQDLKSHLSKIEQKLIKQEEVLTLLTVARDIEPLMHKVGIVCLVYMRGIHQGKQYKLASQKATLLLTTLYNTLLSCDTLFETPLLDGENIDVNFGQKYNAVDMLKLLLPMWIQTCRPFINIIDTWISHGYLTDPHNEFIIQRNKEIETMDETFWEKSFAFHTMIKDPDKSRNSSDKRVQEYDTMDWAPKFLQPVLQQIVLTGKSMEMLEGLGKLAEYDGKGSSGHLNEFKETHLYDKFISSLLTLLGTKTDSNTGDDTRERTPSKPVFSPDIELQMKEKGIHDSFLKMHFENLMTQDTDHHSIIEENFAKKMEALNMDNLQPVELILQECLYPHVYRQYEKVCLKLVDTLKTEYHLIDYFKAMRGFFLMGAGDTMFIFYTEIFDKIRLHEHWKDTTTVTWALHEALDRHFPDEVPRIAVLVDTREDDRESQPINVTNCLKLQYQIPSPVDVVINERCQEIYNQIFSFLLQVKRAKYCLDELRFYDLGKQSIPSATDRMFKSHSTDSMPRSAKIHRMHLLRMKLINFVNSLHNYIMTRILHSIGLEFTHDLRKAKDLDEIIEIHAGYIRKIHERCLLHKKNTFLKEAVLKVLNLSLRFQKEWDCGIDNISMTQIEDTEMEFSRCIQFLRSFLSSVIQRGSFPHLEALAFGLENLIPR